MYTHTLWSIRWPFCEGEDKCTSPLSKQVVYMPPLSLPPTDFSPSSVCLLHPLLLFHLHDLWVIWSKRCDAALKILLWFYLALWKVIFSFLLSSVFIFLALIHLSLWDGLKVETLWLVMIVFAVWRHVIIGCELWPIWSSRVGGFHLCLLLCWWLNISLIKQRLCVSVYALVSVSSITGGSPSHSSLCCHIR